MSVFLGLMRPVKKDQFVSHRCYRLQWEEFCVLLFSGVFP